MPSPPQDPGIKETTGGEGPKLSPPVVPTLDQANAIMKSEPIPNHEAPNPEPGSDKSKAHETQPTHSQNAPKDPDY